MSGIALEPPPFWHLNSTLDEISFIQFYSLIYHFIFMVQDIKTSLASCLRAQSL